MAETAGVGDVYRYNQPEKLAGNSKGGNLDMTDFLTLLTAQLKNQDIFNPVGDTEFVAQMAQFSTLQGIQELSSYSKAQQASAFVGKHVSVATFDEHGNLFEDAGIVETVTFYEGQPMLVVNGKKYGLSEVMEVHATAKLSESEDDEDSEETEGVDEETAEDTSIEALGLGGELFDEYNNYYTASLNMGNSPYVGLSPELWPENL